MQIVQIALAVLAFGLMILAHEFGHFIVAKRAGILVHTFAIGFRPTLFKWRRGETQYELNVLPLGGYVRMEGEDFEDGAKSGSFRSKSLCQRIAVIAAGPAMNLVLAVVLLAVGASAYGVPQGVTNEIVEIRPGWPAAEAGLRPRDRIVAIDGVRVEDGQQMVRTIHRSAGKPLVLDVRRGTEIFQVRVTPRLEPRMNVGATGVTPGVQRARYDPIAAIGWGVQQSARYVSDIFTGLARVFRAGRMLDDLSGPVGAVRVLSDAARAGLDSYLFMTAFLSVMIGIFNLLPIPALDGGRLMFLFVEAIRRRVVDPRREGYIHVIGFALLITLILVLTFRDLTRWASGG